MGCGRPHHHFGNTQSVRVLGKGDIQMLVSDIGVDAFRERSMNEHFNRIGLSVCGYRLDAYRQLPEGWAAGYATWMDLNMWRKFYAHPSFRFGSTRSVTAVILGDHLRRQATLADRVEETRALLEKIKDPAGRADLISTACQAMQS